jgi:hypothetical protein
MTAYVLAPGQSAGKGSEPPLGLEAAGSSPNIFFGLATFSTTVLRAPCGFQYW